MSKPFVLYEKPIPIEAKEIHKHERTCLNTHLRSGKPSSCTNGDFTTSINTIYLYDKNILHISRRSNDGSHYRNGVIGKTGLITWKLNATKSNKKKNAWKIDHL